MKFPLLRLRAIVISHLHGDHYFGIFGLLNTMSMNGRTEELLLIGPPGLDLAVTEILRQGRTFLTYALRFIATDPDQVQVVFSGEYLRIETFPLLHGVPCTGFCFKLRPPERKLIKERLPEAITVQEIRWLKAGKDVYNEQGGVKYAVAQLAYPAGTEKSYAYCSDTAYLPRLSTYLKAVDLLYHEATFSEKMVERAIATGHSTARQAAQLARDAGVKKLLIGHLSSRYKEPEVLLEEARLLFPETEYATEGVTFDV